MDITIIGSGRAGGSVGNALVGSNFFKIKALSSRTNIYKSKLKFIENLKYYGEDNLEAIKHGKIIIIATPDDIIKHVVNEIIDSPFLENKYIFHLSGSRPSTILEPLKNGDNFIGSIHPLQSMPDPKTGAENLKNAYFCLEGDKEAVKIGKKLVNEINGKYFSIDSKYKPLYHAAAVFASNFINTSVYTSYITFRKAGVPEEIIFDIILPLFKGTVKNIEELGIFKSLTGPAIRGDKDTIKSHILNFNKLYE
jgi:predicted short-subunit dehydrogenase-like oxidoreductase (DUF2520 family)